MRTAAGSLLVREAGGELAIDEGPLGRPQVVAAGPRLAPLLRRLLTDWLSQEEGRE